MSRLTILSPAASSAVLASTAGAVRVVVEPSFAAFPATVTATVHDGAGGVASAVTAGVVDNEAILEVAWPVEPGTYRLTAACTGALGIELASATQEVVVTPAPKAS